MSDTPKPHAGIIKKDELAVIITDLNFNVDQQAVYADSYELMTHGLKKHFRLLAPINNTEAVQYAREHPVSSDTASQSWPTKRVMAILWFGKYYHAGIVIEILGKDIEKHMTKIAHELVDHFEFEAPVVIRTLKEPQWI